MSGFSAEWLALREPADARARNKMLAAELAGRLSGCDAPRFADLGCGTGSNLRAIALSLPPGQRQHWRLFDHDPALLQAARHALCGWAENYEDTGEGVRLTKQGRELDVQFCEANLDAGIEALPQAGEIVTASAFFDLVSEGWISRFAKAVSKARAPVYAVLTYNGAETWLPPHPADGPILAAFHTHQGGDKGFGNAAGPRAARCLSAALEAEGYLLLSGESPWQLDENDRGMIEALAHGSASAVSELKLVGEEAVAAWRETRCRAASCVIGHTDLLAWPRA
jgi:SAM-dependent methyltransferase